MVKLRKNIAEEFERLAKSIKKEISLEKIKEILDEQYEEKAKEEIKIGRKQLLIRKYLELYKTGRCSIDKASEAVGITVTEMMQEAAKEGIKSTETIEEYKKGLKLLLS